MELDCCGMSGRIGKAGDLGSRRTVHMEQLIERSTRVQNVVHDGFGITHDGVIVAQDSPGITRFHPRKYDSLN